MKNFFAKSIAVLILLIIGSQGAALAQYSVPAADTILPADIDAYYEINTSVKNPIEDFVLIQLEEAVQNESNAVTIKEILARAIADNTATLAVKMNFPETVDNITYMSIPDTYITFHISDEDYQALNDSTEVTEEKYGNQTVYGINGDVQFYTALNGLFVMTNSKENIQNVINRHNGTLYDSLSKVDSYKAVRSHYLEDSFLNLYINPTVIADLSSVPVGWPKDTFFALEMELLNKQFIEALTAEGVSISQESNGFGFAASVEADLAKLQALDLEFDNYNTTPTLYSTVSGDNLIYYEEQANLTQRFKNMFKTLNLSEEQLQQYNDWKVKFKTDSGIDFDQEVLPLFSGNSMTTVHKTDQIWPGITLVIDLGSQKALGTSTLNKFVEYLKKQAAKSDQSELITFGTLVTNNDGTFHSIVINLKDSDGMGDLAALDRAMTDIYIRMGVSGDGKLVISNVPDLDSLLAGSLTDNDNFDSSFVNKPETIESVLYLSIDELQLYIQGLLETFDVDTETRDIYNALLEPWNSFYAKSFADADTTWAKGFVNVDIEGLYKYAEILEKAFTAASRSTIVPTREFCDVHSDSWFFPYIQELQSEGVVSGYADGCFRPNQPVTRAEFLKMVIKARENRGYVYGVYAAGNVSNIPPSRAYADVDQNSWYAGYIDQALANNFAKGYSDGTFRPNANITRAEAVQVLNNIAPYLAQDLGVGPVTELPFTDVHSYDWFHDAVETTYDYNIINGVTPSTFEPNRNLTRAESAKIISIFRWL